MPVRDGQQQLQRFETLLTDETYQVAWRYCCSLTTTSADAEDLLHDALYHALRRIDQVREATAFRGWLVAIVRSRFLNGLRRSRQEAQGRARLAELRALEPTDARAAVTAAGLARLPEEQRSLLTLFYLEGFSMQELATALGIRPLAVQGRLARAREALRRELLKDGVAPAPAQRSETHG